MPGPAVRIFVDGYVGPDGVGGFAAVVAGGPTLSGRTAGDPSHLVEWRAVAAALAWLEMIDGPAEVTLATDSALVERGLASRRPEMSGVAGEVRAGCRRALARLAASGVKVRIERVPRTQNAEADAAARAAAGRS